MFPRLGTDPDERPGEEELRQLVERAQKGDPTVLPELRRMLDHNAELWRVYGDLARHAEESLIGLAAGDNLLLQESLRRKVLELKARLAANGPLEQLLVERVMTCWLAANHADAVFGQTHGAQGSRGDQLRRRQDSANHRFLEALKLLATVRRLLGPVGEHDRRGETGAKSCAKEQRRPPV